MRERSRGRELGKGMERGKVSGAAGRSCRGVAGHGADHRTGRGMRGGDAGAGGRGEFLARAWLVREAAYGRRRCCSAAGLCMGSWHGEVALGVMDVEKIRIEWWKRNCRWD